MRNYEEDHFGMQHIAQCLLESIRLIYMQRVRHAVYVYPQQYPYRPPCYPAVSLVVCQSGNHVMPVAASIDQVMLQSLHLHPQIVLVCWGRQTHVSAMWVHHDMT